MPTAEVLLLLLVSTALFGVIARKLRVPDAIVLVVAGLGVSLVPGLPHPTLQPDNVFLIVLPPLLYAQAWFTSWPDFKKWFRGIFLLAVGLVLFTTLLVAFTLHAFVPELPYSLCFALGAIVSPPDAVAASAIAQAFRLPKRVVTILEGESLVNDATGLVALSFALAALESGRFSLFAASGRFVVVAAGGIAVGLGLAVAFTPIFRRVKDDAIALALSLVVPYSAYLLAERLHVSGVLAVVSAGMLLGARASQILSANARLQGFGFWSTLVFLLNGSVFLMIGLQLPEILARMNGVGRPIGELLKLALPICGVVIGARLVWVFPGAYLPHLLSPRIHRTESVPSWRNVTIIGWSGMRGVVSIAAAMSLPLTIGTTGVPLPGRDLLIFLAFAVTLATLVLQGLSLPLMIRLLGVHESGDAQAEEERGARIAAVTASLKRVRELLLDPTVDPEAGRVVVADFEDRLRRLHAGRASIVGDKGGAKKLIGSLRLRRVALLAARELVLEHHAKGALSRELLVKVERELDLEELQLTSGESAAP